MILEDVRGFAARYGEIGLCLQWLCGPKCDGSSHGPGHPPNQAGKVPLRPGWSKLGYRPPDVLIAQLAQFAGGANLSILTGWQPSARFSVAVVDLDSPEALAWAMAHLPYTPWRVKTRRGEHWYYRCFSRVPARNFRHSVPPMDMEVSGNGRQVVAPPSTHASGHVYHEIGDAPWSADDQLPTYDPAWFAAFGRGKSSQDADGTWSSGDQSSWPGDREFTVADYIDAGERAMAYLTAEATPVSVSGRGGDDALHAVALDVVRGFPIASQTRLKAMMDAGGAAAPVDAQDALSEAHRLICECWNPRCLDSDGETPYPWDEDRVRYKVEQAADADRLPGPDYWIFDDPEHRRRWSERNGDLSYLTSGPVAVELADPVQTAHRPAARADEPAYRREAAEFLEDTRRFTSAGEWRPPDPSAHPPPPPRGRDRDTVLIGPDILAMAQAAARACAQIPSLFVKDGKICDVIEDQEDAGSKFEPRPPILRETPKAYLIALLSAHAKWTRREDDDAPGCRPDVQAINALMTLGKWPQIPRITAIVSTPVVRSDGTILQRPGWDPDTGLLYSPGKMHLDPINAAPTRRNCAFALASLLDVVRDFPFVDQDRARAVWLSAVLTRFCRYAFRGSVPMFAVSANTKSAGKGKVVDSACLISDGRPADKVVYTGDVDEDNRVILAQLMACTPSVCLDNIDRGRPLASAAFEVLLTAPSFGARVIGTSKFYRAHFADTTWWATGNGLETAGDMSRRVLRMDLLDRTGDPAGRPVAHPQLEEWVSANRPHLVRAALTLLSGWYAAGRPCSDLPALPSYEAWSAVVRSCVVWCGLPDPAGAVGKISDDAVGSAREVLLRHLLPFGPILASDLAAMLASDAKRPGGPRYKAFHSFLCEHNVALTGQNPGVSVGRFFSKHVDQTTVVDGQKLTLLKKQTTAGTLYTVHPGKE